MPQHTNPAGLKKKKKKKLLLLPFEARWIQTQPGESDLTQTYSGGSSSWGSGALSPHAASGNCPVTPWTRPGSPGGIPDHSQGKGLGCKWWPGLRCAPHDTSSPTCSTFISNPTPPPRRSLSTHSPHDAVAVPPRDAFTPIQINLNKMLLQSGILSFDECF